jgi:hypothetical protein
MTENEIWNWFSKNNKDLIDFLHSDMSDYSIYNEFTGLVQQFSEYLFPEITGHESGKYVLIITCDSRREGIPFVEKLCNAAPIFENWIIEKYRKPGHILQLNFNGLEFEAEDVKVNYQMTNGIYDIKILIANYNRDDDRYKSLAFLYLDHFVGEYAVMTKIGYIDFDNLSKNADGVALEEFRKIIGIELN